MTLVFRQMQKTIESRLYCGALDTNTAWINMCFEFPSLLRSSSLFVYGRTNVNITFHDHFVKKVQSSWPCTICLRNFFYLH